MIARISIFYNEIKPIKQNSIVTAKITMLSNFGQRQL